MKVMDKLKKAFGLDEEAYEDIESWRDEEGFEEPEATKERPAFGSMKKEPTKDKDMATVLRDESASGLKIIKPETFEDAMSIVTELRKGEILILNTSKMEMKTAQRLLDFVAGASYAMGGDIQEVMEAVYAVSPRGIAMKNQEHGKSRFGF